MTKAGSPVSDETRSLGFWSATPRNQPAAVTARAALRPGDALVVTRIDRLARSLKDLQDIVRELKERRVALRATEQPINTGTAARPSSTSWAYSPSSKPTCERNARPKELPRRRRAVSTRGGSRKSIPRSSTSSGTGEARAGRYCTTVRHWPGQRLARTWEEGGGVVAPIRPELRPLYPPHWREPSSHVRFERTEGRCQRCGRPHLALLRCLPDGRWFDKQVATWRDRRGTPCPLARPCGGDSVSDDGRRTRSGAPGQRSDQRSANESARALSTLPHGARSAAPFGTALDHLAPAPGSRRSLPRSVPGIDRRADIETDVRPNGIPINVASSLFSALRCFGRSFMYH